MWRWWLTPSCCTNLGVSVALWSISALNLSFHPLANMPDCGRWWAWTNNMIGDIADLLQQNNAFDDT